MPAMARMSSFTQTGMSNDVHVKLLGSVVIEAILELTTTAIAANAKSAIGNIFDQDLLHHLCSLQHLQCLNFKSLEVDDAVFRSRKPRWPARRIL